MLLLLKHIDWLEEILDTSFPFGEKLSLAVFVDIGDVDFSQIIIMIFCDYIQFWENSAQCEKTVPRLGTNIHSFYLGKCCIFELLWHNSES